MSEKLYVCIMSATRPDTVGLLLVVATAGLVCEATSKEEAIGKALNSTELLWPRAEKFFNHSVSVEEFSKWMINAVYRLYPQEAK